jgi:hypothetical protein
VVDYRKLNQKTEGDAYPLRDITDIFDQVRQENYYSCLDLAMGYHQIDMDPNDIDKTAFSTKQGHWTYRKMPFTDRPGDVSANDEYISKERNRHAMICVFR